MRFGFRGVLRRSLLQVSVMTAMLGLFGQFGAPAGAAEPDPAGADIAPTPKAVCGPGSNPETGTQGRVPKSEVDSGRAAKGYSCNAVQVSRLGPFGEAGSGGYKVERYVDKAGRECAYYDTTLLFPANAQGLANANLTGVAVLDMSNPAKPVRTTTLVTPAMQSPHESLALNHKRGLLAAVTANPVFYPGIVDVYDVSVDCRNPVLKSSAPIGVLGHESGFAPDGRTYYVAALHAPIVVAIDLDDPVVPKVLGTFRHYAHGLNLSDDGNRLYLAKYDNAAEPSPRGLAIFDSSQIQSRVPNPSLPLISTTTWALVSTPQINLPVTIGGRPYLVEMDEFRGSPFRVGAARIIDIANEKAPKVVGNMRLEVNQAAAHQGEQANDYGTGSLQNYVGHYCNVPSRVDPGIVACTFILSGLRVFDIRDPANPREIAYFNGPIAAGGSAYAMSSPAFVPERNEIWYSDGNTGFYVVRLTNGVWPKTAKASTDVSTGPAVAAAAPAGPKSGRGRTLPATGELHALQPTGIAAAAALVALTIRRSRRRANSSA